MAQKRIWTLYGIILMIVILAALIMIIVQNVKLTGNVSESSITGHATEDTTVSNVSIQYFLSIELCTNLSEGIIFGEVTTLPAIDLNGSHNYDGGADNINSTYCINVSGDSNTAVDFCIKANWDMNNSADDKVLLGNETWSNFTTTNYTAPALVDAVALTTGYVDAGSGIAKETENYYRFWLGIPVGQQSGDYENTIYFKGVTEGTSC